MADSRQRAQYTNRQSNAMRNPHAAKTPLSIKQLSRLSTEERVLRQWDACYGAPVSDMSKAKFVINTLGHTFTLADIRLWKEDLTEVKTEGKLHLEFFFDGLQAEIDGQEDAFKRAFEELVESQLKEKRIAEFREKLAGTARRRGNRGSAEAEDGGADDADSDWKSYLKTPAPATELSVRALREAGCMIRFMVCQTSLSISAAEELGHVAFPEHFPINGVAQVDVYSKPLPRWVFYMLALTALLCMLTMLAWWRIMKPVLGLK